MSHRYVLTTYAYSGNDLVTSQLTLFLQKAKMCTDGRLNLKKLHYKSKLCIGD